MTPQIMVFALWGGIGLMNLINCFCLHRECKWYDYWLMYAVLMTALAEHAFR